jgi:hypothetical protein
MRACLPHVRVSRVGILGVGSALAPHVARQVDLLPALVPLLESGSARERLARRIFANTCIEERRFCIPDFRYAAAIDRRAVEENARGGTR